LKKHVEVLPNENAAGMQVVVGTASSALHEPSRRAQSIARVHMLPKDQSEFSRNLKNIDVTQPCESNGQFCRDNNKDIVLKKLSREFPKDFFERNREGNTQSL
jgi:hypothetical protein